MASKVFIVEVDANVPVHDYTIKIAVSRYINDRLGVNYNKLVVKEIKDKESDEG